MKALIQRVAEASVTVDGEEVSRIGPGLLVLFCAEVGDGEGVAALLARKVASLRIFEDEAGRMNRSVLDIGGEALVVSQFTLAADTSRGNRPGFSGAAAPEIARALYGDFCAMLEGHGLPVRQGCFAAHMRVALVNDGPVTIWLDTR